MATAPRLGPVVVFYGLNDVHLDAPEDASDLVIAVATGSCDHQVAARLESWTR